MYPRHSPKTSRVDTRTDFNFARAGGAHVLTPGQGGYGMNIRYVTIPLDLGHRLTSLWERS
jgi:hypothetical protein